MDRLGTLAAGALAAALMLVAAPTADAHRADYWEARSTALRYFDDDAHCWWYGCRNRTVTDTTHIGDHGRGIYMRQERYECGSVCRWRVLYLDVRVNHWGNVAEELFSNY